jgi:hypothetical protein
MEDRYKALMGCFGIGCLTVIECYALHKGIDSAMLAAVVGTIGTLVGLAFGVYLGKK